MSNIEVTTSIFDIFHSTFIISYMQTDTGTVILFLALALIAATIVCMGLLIFLNDLKVISLKRRVDYLKWGIAGGILICSFLAIMQCNRIYHT